MISILCYEFPRSLGWDGSYRQQLLELTVLCILDCSSTWLYSFKKRLISWWSSLDITIPPGPGVSRGDILHLEAAALSREHLGLDCPQLINIDLNNLPHPHSQSSRPGMSTGERSSLPHLQETWHHSQQAVELLFLLSLLLYHFYHDELYRCWIKYSWIHSSQCECVADNEI